MCVTLYLGSWIGTLTKSKVIFTITINKDMVLNLTHCLIHHETNFSIQKCWIHLVRVIFRSRSLIFYLFFLVQSPTDESCCCASTVSKTFGTFWKRCSLLSLTSFPLFIWRIDEGVYVNNSGSLVKHAVMQWGETPYTIGKCFPLCCTVEINVNDDLW